MWEGPGTWERASRKEAQILKEAPLLQGSTPRVELQTLALNRWDDGAQEYSSCSCGAGGPEQKPGAVVPGRGARTLKVPPQVGAPAAACWEGLLCGCSSGSCDSGGLKLL